MSNMRSDIVKLFKAVGEGIGATYREFPRDIVGHTEVPPDSTPMPSPPSQGYSSSDGMIENLKQEDFADGVGQDASDTLHMDKAVRTESTEKQSGGVEEAVVPSSLQNPAEKVIDKIDYIKFSMLDHLLNKERISEEMPKPGKRVPCVAIYSPLGGAGCSTIASGLAWLLAKNDQSPLIVDLGGVGMNRIYFGMQGRDLEGEASWNMTVGSLSEDARMVGLVSASRREAVATATTILSWIDGAATPKEVAPLLDLMGRPDWVIFDVSSARFDLLDTLITRVDTLVVPLRGVVESVLAIEEMQKEITSAKRGKKGSPQCIYTLNHFESENLLHLEIASILHQRFGEFIATKPMPLDPGLARAVANENAFSSSLFSENNDWIQSLLLRCSLASLSSDNLLKGFS